MTEPSVTRELRDRIGGEAAPRLERAARAGFLGSMPIAEQIDHALGFVAAVEAAPGSPGSSPRSVLDLGSGGGIPGFVLVECWPEAHVTLLDANERRAAFLGEEVEAAGWGDRVEVVLRRAEEAGRDEGYREHFDVVTARSFAPPPVTAECSSPLLSTGGIVVVSEPPDVPGHERWPAEGLAELSLVPESSYRFDSRFGYQVLRKTGPVSERYPRRTGVPGKRPLF